MKAVYKEMPADSLTAKCSPTRKLDCVMEFFKMRVHLTSFFCFFLFHENELEYDLKAFTYIISETFVNSFHGGFLKSSEDMMSASVKAHEIISALESSFVLRRDKNKISYLDDFFYLTSKEYLESLLGKDVFCEVLDEIKESYKKLLSTSKEMSED